METDTKVIEVELVKANITDQVINKMRDDYMPLKVKDIYDKPGFEAVTTARKEVKKFRVTVEKILKEVRQPALDFQKSVVAKEKEVVAKISEIEDYLTSQEDIFNRVEHTIVTPLTDDELIVNYKKALLAVKAPELTTNEGKEKLIILINGLTNLLK